MGALRSSEALLRGFFDAAPMLMGIVEIVDGDLRHLSANTAAGEFYGVAPESLRGRFASELGEPENVIRDWIGRLRESERAGGRVRFDYELPRSNGPRWLTATVAPAPAPPGADPRFAYIVEDVTDRRAIEGAARAMVEPPERPAASAMVVVDCITDVFFAVDRDWNFTYANHQAERTFQRNREEFLGRNVWDVFPKAMGTLFETEGRRAMDLGVTVRFEEYSPSYDAWFEAHIYPNPDGLSVFLCNITDRKRAEQERDRLVLELEAALRDLAVSREDLSRAQAVAHTGSWRLDVRHNVLQWSEESCRIFGVTEGTSVTYERFLSAVHPEDREAVDRAWNDALTHGTPYDIEHRILVNGEIKWVRELAELEFDEDGTLRGGFGTVQDITERRRVEETLRDSERRYRFMAEASPQVVWTADATGALDYFNNRISELTGHTPDEVLGAPWQAIVPEEEHDAMTAAWAHSVQTGEPFLAEHRIICLDGTERWFLTRALPFKDEEGRIGKWFGSTMDIHERRIVEQALRESEVRFRHLADAMPQLVWTAQPDGRLDYVNQRVSEFGGAYWVNGAWKWEPLVHPDDLERTKQAWSDAIQHGTVYQVEHRLGRAGGEYGWYLSRAVCYRDRDGELVKWYGTSTDIQDQKQAEAILAQADEAKDRFVAMLAHELRNPLNAAMMALHAMRITEARTGRPDMNLGEVIGRQVATMTGLVNDLMDVAGIKQGKVLLHRKPVALSVILENAVETVRPLIEEKGHTLEVQSPEETVWLDADPLRLVQVVGNLLNNAAKYTEPGGRIRLSAGVEGGQLVVQVADNGIGIAPEMLERVFDLFAQAETANVRSRGGLGLGLTLVRKLVEMHGGTVEAASGGPGQGSTFTVRLPSARRAQ